MSSNDSDNRCQYKNAEGKRCGTLRAAEHPSFCSYHATPKPPAAKPQEKLGAELLGPLKDLNTSSAINHLLGKLLLLLADRRITRQDAAAMGYICQLLPQSVSGVAHERNITQDFAKLTEDLTRICEAIPGLQEIHAANRRAGQGH